MASLNKLIMIGNAGKEAELRYSQGGKPIARFSLAVNKKSGDKTYTLWITVISFFKLAEIVAQHIKKGTQCYVEGSLQVREWQDKQNQTRTAVELLADKIIFLGSKQEDTLEYPFIHDVDVPMATPTPSFPHGRPLQEPLISQAKNYNYADTNDEDIPF